jgi:hypothetical protein
MINMPVMYIYLHAFSMMMKYFDDKNLVYSVFSLGLATFQLDHNLSTL